MESILLKNVKFLITNDEENECKSGIDIRIEKGKIQNVSKNISGTGRERIIDCSKCVVMPGLINTHHHFYQSMYRCIRSVQEMPLFSWLTNLYEVWKYLDDEVVYLSTKLTIAELLKTGCTLTADHHYVFPNNCSNDLIENQIKAASEMSIRFHPTRGSMSRGKRLGGLPPDSVVQIEDEIMYDSEKLINKYHDPKEGSMCRIGLAPCSPFSVSKELMKMSAELARKNHKVYLHTHLAETLDEEEFCKSMYGCRPAELMEKVNWIGSDVWFAHGIYLDEKDLNILKGVGFSHCPSSNMKLNSGVFNLSKIVNDGFNVSIAVDGGASNDGSNLWEEMKRAFLLNHLSVGQKALSASEIIKIATLGGAKTLGRDELGKIKEGFVADIIIKNISGIEYSGVDDMNYGLLTCGISGEVDYNIINGKIVVDKRKIVSNNTDKIINDVRNKVMEIHKKFKSNKKYFF